MSTVTKPLANGGTIEIIDTTGQFSRSSTRVPLAVLRDPEGVVTDVIWNDGTTSHPNADQA